MKKNFVLTLLCLLGLGLNTQAQTLIITLDAAAGVGGPSGSLTLGGYAGQTSCNMHTGPAPAAGDPWCAGVGTWGDLASNLPMTSVGTDMWEVTVNVSDYYQATADASCTPAGEFDAVGAVFANDTWDWELKGPDATGGGGDIYIDLSSLDVSAGQGADNVPWTGMTVVEEGGTGFEVFDNTEIALSSFPNPFTDVVNFSYTLESSAEVSLTVYDATGRAIDMVAGQSQFPGNQVITWNAADREAGMYFYVLNIGEKAYAGSIVHN